MNPATCQWMEFCLLTENPDVCTVLPSLSALLRQCHKQVWDTVAKLLALSWQCHKATSSVVTVLLPNSTFTMVLPNFGTFRKVPHQEQPAILGQCCQAISTFVPVMKTISFGTVLINSRNFQDSVNKQFVFKSATNQLELLERCQQAITFGDCVINQSALLRQCYQTALLGQCCKTVIKFGKVTKQHSWSNAAKLHCFSTRFLYTPVLTPNNVSNLTW